MIGAGGIVGPTEAVHLTSPLTPSLLAGPSPTMATDSFESLQLCGLSASRGWRRYSAESQVWSGTRGPLAQAAQSAFSISRGVATTMAKPYRPANGATYPVEFPASDLAGR